MPFMGCAEYRSLKMQNEYARRRIWRYNHPHADPVLSSSGATPSEHLLAHGEGPKSWRLSARLDAHQEMCEACREGRPQIAMG